MADKRPFYDGEYKAVSKVDGEYRLATANKRLKRNIIVQAIPYSETSNNGGGVTVYIGKESELYYGN